MKVKYIGDYYKVTLIKGKSDNPTAYWMTQRVNYEE
jgi:hypothetical protein